ncbi:polysaccharide pyruvyl transferase WcaK-like protein [Nocardioides marinus]|uniref:Polysaccharide pyruvyl transferase WcaK-like protein n=1 Tax=Nocardioides marinus TaxID=374514 RepID=A0A7Y9YG01_9ACTN|nr:polysaccharide pyruvyl transferase WcaK-like protein [Nocardioides marinus]
MITQAIRRELVEFGSDQWPSYSTHRHPSLGEVLQLRRADLLVAGGSNMLKSRMEINRQWLVTPDLAWSMRRKIVLCGVGWWQYQDDPNGYSRALLKRILDPSALHSVRDSYTEEKVRRLGFEVVNTGCPTMWSLAGSSASSVTSRPDTVVTTVTDYNRDPARDVSMLRSLARLYERVLFVGMAEQDLVYYRSDLQVEGVTEVGWGLDTLNSCLTPGVDYFGTRLHAGVRALQRGCSAAVLAIDNRAREISRDTGLQVVMPDGITDRAIAQAVVAGTAVGLRIPLQQIAMWREAFWRRLNA